MADICSRDDCLSPKIARGLCRLHYDKLRADRYKKVRAVKFIKVCTACDQPKPSSEYGFHSNTKDGLRPDCKECHAKYHRARRADNPQDYRRMELARNYGITPEQYDNLLEDQNHCCAICGTHSSNAGGPRKTVLMVDHNHKTAVVRGLLCHK